MKVTLVGVNHSGEITVKPEVYANWDLGQKRMAQLEKDYDKEDGFDVYAVEQSVQKTVLP